MSRFKCECLNVTLHAKEKSVRKVNGQDFVTDAVGFFAGEICEVDLAVAGITKEVASLVCQSRVEDWNIFTCVNCAKATHALHAVKGHDRVLISQTLESDENALKEKIKSSKYSSIFKIIVEPVETSEASERTGKGGAVLLNQKALSSSMILVEEQVKKYLKVEEEAMEDRIRKCVQKERDAFAAIQTQALKDKRAVHSVLSKAEEKTLQTSLHEAMSETTKNPVIAPNIGQTSASRAEKEERLSAKKETVKQVHITQAYPTTIPDPLLRKPRRHQKFLRKNISAGDSDAMFVLDGFNEDSEPFFESEEDDLSSDNSFQNEDSSGYNYHVISKMAVRGNPRAANYSSSVPIHMPVEHKPINPWDDDDDDEFAIPEPSKIGESMKALAQSLQDSVFGELPRPRLLTDPARASYR